MNLDEALAEIALEAERQGFHVQQTKSGVWIIDTKDGFHQGWARVPPLFRGRVNRLADV